MEERKRLGYVGLGKMGFNMVERLISHGYSLVLYDDNPAIMRKATHLTAEFAPNLASLARSLERPRLVWLMVPADIVESVLRGLANYLDKRDTVIDGGNSHYKDSMLRAGELSVRGIEFLDAGVSGGPSGALNGSCIMVGGNKECFDQYEHVFRDLAVPDGYRYMGSSGTGHFVKMVHNGIEYGMMQALAEGFAVLKASPFDLNLDDIADLFNHGSVVSSRLAGWLKQAYDKFGQDLDAISGAAAQSGEGRWTVEAANELRVDVPIIRNAVEFRDASAHQPSYAGQVISALRHQFGGHDVFKR